MYNYMRALEDRFTPKLNDKQRRDLEAKRQEVATLRTSRAERSCSGWWAPTQWHRRR